MAATGTRSLERALGLLTEVAAHDLRGARLTDLAGALGLEPSTAHRLLHRLTAEGFLQKDERNRYHLGRRIFEFGQLAAQRLALPPAVGAALQRAADQLGDTVFLTMRSGAEMVCVARCEGSFPIKVVAMQVGSRRPIGVGTSGVALLAAMVPDEAEALLAAGSEHLRSYGSASPARIRHRVAYARRIGHAVTESYLTRGIGGIGLAVPGGSGPPVYAVSVIGLVSRLRPPRRAGIVACLRETAAAIAAGLSG